MFEHIDYILANYFSAETGHSEQKALDCLRLEVGLDTSIWKELRLQLARAFSEPEFSWKSTFSRNNVCDFADEDTARTYAERLLRQVLKNHLG